MKEVDEKSQGVTDDTVIWKYMDFFQFMDLIINEDLFFSRLSKLEDAQEGGLTGEEKKLILEKCKDLNKTEIVEALKKLFEPTDSRFVSLDCIDMKQIDEIYERVSHESFIKKLIDIILTSYKESILVSCWHIGKHENYSMWKIYGNKGIAIKSTIGRLKTALSNAKRTHLMKFGKVDYFLEKERRNNIPLLLNTGKLAEYKSIHYRYEEEFRAYFIGSILYKRSVGSKKRELYGALEENMKKIKEASFSKGLKNAYLLSLYALYSSNPDDGKMGLKIRIDGDLIDQIYISPFIPKWQYLLIACFISSYYKDFDITKNLVLSGIKLNN